MAERRRWLAVLALFGLTSLLADMCYEGFRGILGPVAFREAHATWLELGAVLAGAELINWGLRLPAALLVDAIRGYWGFTILGYALVPVGVALALTGGMAGLVVGVVIERLGKTLRSPARDALLSGLGGPRGLIYGLHELMDQIGAIAGPLLAAYAIAAGTPWLIVLPGAAAVATITVARLLYPGRLTGGGVSRPTRLYARFTLLGLTAALSPHPVIVAAAAAGSSSPLWAPIAYTIAMAVDAVAALPLGRLYDRVGWGAVLAAPTAGVASYTLLALGHPVASAALLGVSLAAYESVYRAYVAERAPEKAGGFGALALGLGLGQAAAALASSLIASSIYPLSTR